MVFITVCHKYCHLVSGKFRFDVHMLRPTYYENCDNFKFFYDAYVQEITIFRRVPGIKVLPSPCFESRTFFYFCKSGHPLIFLEINLGASPLHENLSILIIQDSPFKNK